MNIVFCRCVCVCVYCVCIVCVYIYICRKLHGMCVYIHMSEIAWNYIEMYGIKRREFESFEAAVICVAQVWDGSLAQFWGQLWMFGRKKNWQR